MLLGSALHSAIFYPIYTVVTGPLHLSLPLRQSFLDEMETPWLAASIHGAFEFTQSISWLLLLEYHDQIAI